MSGDTEKKIALAIGVLFGATIILFALGEWVELPRPARIFADLFAPSGVFILITVRQMFKEKLFVDDV